MNDLSMRLKEKPQVGTGTPAVGVRT